MVPCRINGPFAVVTRSHEPARIAASSQGGLVALAIVHFSAGCGRYKTNVFYSADAHRRHKSGGKQPFRSYCTYIDRIFASNPSKRVWRFSISLGSNMPLPTRKTRTGQRPRAFRASERHGARQLISSFTSLKGLVYPPKGFSLGFQVPSAVP